MSFCHRTMNSHSEEGSAKMSCMVKQSPSQNKPRCIDGDESFESLQREALSYTQRAALHPKRLCFCRASIHSYLHIHPHTLDFVHAQIHISPLQQKHDCKEHLVRKGVIAYISCCERNHGEKDYAQFSFWHLCAHCSQDSHNSTRLWI